MSAIHALVLAAGAGSRFGGRKLTAPFEAGLLVHRALASALDAPVEGVILVVGAGAAEVAAAAWDVAGTDPRLSIVHAPDHAEGMSASIRAGIAALPEDATGVIVFLGDMPRIPRTIAAEVAAALEAGAAAAAPVFEGRRGHPVGFSRTQFPALAALAGDRGGGTVLAALGPAVVEIPAPDSGVLADVDTPADLAALTGSARGGQPPHPS